MTEKQLENKCCDYARSKGIVAVKLEQVGMVGIPDRMFIKQGGDTIFIEFKRMKQGVLSNEQKFWLSFLGDKGCVVDSFDNFKEIINRFYNH